jgi:hypothetical protein
VGSCSVIADTSVITDTRVFPDCKASPTRTIRQDPWRWAAPSKVRFGASIEGSDASVQQSRIERIQPLAASRSATLLSSSEALLKGSVLGLPRLIDEKSAEQAGPCSGGRA